MVHHALHLTIASRFLDLVDAVFFAMASGARRGQPPIGDTMGMNHRQSEEMVIELLTI